MGITFKVCHLPIRVFWDGTSIYLKLYWLAARIKWLWKNCQKLVLCNFKEEDSRSCICYDLFVVGFMSFYCHLVDIACVLEEDSQDSIQMQMLQAGMLYLMILKGCVIFMTYSWHDMTFMTWRHHLCRESIVKLSIFPVSSDKELWSYGKEFVGEETKILLEIGQRAQRDI